MCEAAGVEYMSCTADESRKTVRLPIYLFAEKSAKNESDSARSFRRP